VPKRLAPPDARDILVWPEPVDEQRIAAHFVSHGEPMSKQRARTFVDDNGTTKTITPPVTVAAEGRITAALYEKGNYREPMGNEDTRWGVRINFYRKSKVKRDIDNMGKLVLDALNTLVWKDDSQIDQLILWRGRDEANPRTECLAYVLP